MIFKKPSYSICLYVFLIAVNVFLNFFKIFHLQLAYNIVFLSGVQHND